MSVGTQRVAESNPRGRHAKPRQDCGHSDVFSNGTRILCGYCGLTGSRVRASVMDEGVVWMPNYGLGGDIYAVSWSLTAYAEALL